ncbi:flippase-like domain-containing protein [Kineosporia babensis]|uniref:Flippase-like domain-containing protein n=1 Tax=Kineosporia babensis TaxID=499548 RepID=A0A9X1NKZ4_9ACTN|nr:flippase-like domain-containing protein [Kineosporia babensis]MCD5315018.1 flippase-like domain-containing protein [Kineosporia babensis]
MNPWQFVVAHRRHAGNALLVLTIPAMIYLVVRTISQMGAGWSEAGHTLLSVEMLWIPALTFFWWAGHCARAGQVTACLPGLSLGKALSLCFAGSAVANSLPLGGALSFGVSAAMIKSWGFSARAMTSYFTLNQIYTVLLRVLFGAISLTWFMAYGPGAQIGSTPVWASAATGGLLVLVCLVLARGQVTAWAGRRVGALLNALREDMGVALRRSWVQLVLSGLCYMLLLGILLHLCLLGLGVHQSFLLILAVVGIERMVTTVPLTPGGAGAAELTIFTCLTAAGVEPAKALAGALLYRFFTFLLEIPVGAAVIVGWRVRHHLTARPATA